MAAHFLAQCASGRNNESAAAAEPGRLFDSNPRILHTYFGGATEKRQRRWYQASKKI